VTVDELARNRIRNDLAATLFVEAGAGTGKTTALVARIVEGITTGALDIHRLAAITFTESAAGELRDRVTVALERAAAATDDLPDAAVRRARAHAALTNLDDAVITTIHGFAQRICAEWSPAAGLPPGFEVRDEIAASVAFEQAWRRFLDDWFADPDATTLLQCATILGCTPRHFRTIAAGVHAHVDRVTDHSERPTPLPTLDFTPLVAALRRACARIVECSDDTDRFAQYLVGLRAFTDRLTRAAEDDALDALDVLMAGPNLYFAYGKRGNWSDLDDAKAALLDANDEQDALLAPLRVAVLRNVGARIARFARALAAARVAAGTLEFDDLLRTARDLLRDNPAARTAIADRWQLLAIDEFQDTDPLQVEIALLLADATAEHVHSDAWESLRPDGGRLFLVGDPKQSIYRFRRADLTLYRQVVERVPGESVALDQNFRTTAPIIEWVNLVIATLIEEGIATQAPWRSLVPARTEHPSDAGAPVVTIGGPRADIHAEPLRELEAETIAAAITRIQAEGWQVCDPRTGNWRAARLADIALLVPTRTAVRSLETALEAAEIPLRLESRSLLWESPEVRDLIIALRAIDDPSDELAVVGALRSPAFACTDRDLLEYVRGGGALDARRTPPPELEDYPVAAALAWLNERHNERWWTSINVVVERVMRERHAFVAALATPRARDRWRRLRFVLDQARAFDAAGGATLRSFLDWVDEQAEHGAYVNDAIAPEPDDDAVRLMTAHAAKGLEFPIVILVGWNQPRAERADAVLWSSVRAGEFEIRVGASGAGLSTEHYEALLVPELDELRAERDRLLYVAATRARDHLLVSLFHKAGTSCDAERLATIIDRHGWVGPNWDEATPVPARPRPIAEPLPGAPQVVDAAWAESRARMLSDAGRPAVIAATTIAHAMRADDEPTPIASETSTETPWRRGRAGTAIGRAVHAVLQTADVRSGSDTDALAGVHAIAEGVPERTSEIAKLARSAIDSASVRAAAAAPRMWREIPVGAPLGNTVLEGYIDLCYETPDGIVIVDYKTDAVSGEAAMAAAVARYTPQGAAYAAALETVVGQPVAGCVFVFCRPGRAVEIAVEDLPGAMAAVRAQLTGPA
jgi:ATP-dependent helicase/nuclease subunit A